MAAAVLKAEAAELPPHARRIHPNYPGVPCWWNYLRMRGEYKRPVRGRYTEGELPPRTRRILFKFPAVQALVGTTSAHAENTKPIMHHVGHGWNYLRARGEYSATPETPRPAVELPPRARRIQRAPLGTGRTFGTTSACAENTAKISYSCHGIRNYLRVRGEYANYTVFAYPLKELPPHARRIPLV